uniref:Uncharacterized protein n=1 Tax=Anser brachyrhynchus TaxID=132585 RepID=A0A8B9BXJ8_9AVES
MAPCFSTQHTWTFSAKVMHVFIDDCTDPLPSLSTAIKAAVLIQKWYRSTRARLEISRRYSLTIFQSIEYADEQDQAQVCNLQFFLYKQLCYSQSTNKMDTRLFLPTNIVGHPSVSHQADSYLTEYENIEVPDSYCGPRLSFPLTLADANALLHAFKDGQVRCN